MPKHPFAAAAEGMPNFNRRSVMAGMAALPAIAAPASANFSNGNVCLHDQMTRLMALADEAYQADYGPEERLRHHLLMAGQAMDELVPERDCRWFVTMGGKAPFEGRFINAQRFQLKPDPEIKGLMIERMHDVMRWQS